MPSKANLIDYMNKIRHKIKSEKKMPVTATVVRTLEGMIEVI